MFFKDYTACADWYSETGPILITHKGFSGPVVLRISAFSARNLHANKYQGELRINWLCMTNYEVKSKLDLYKLENGKKGLLNNKVETNHQFYVSNYTKSFEQSTRFFFKEGVKLEEVNIHQ